MTVSHGIDLIFPFDQPVCVFLIYPLFVCSFFMTVVGGSAGPSHLRPLDAATADREQRYPINSENEIQR